MSQMTDGTFVAGRMPWAGVSLKIACRQLGGLGWPGLLWVALWMNINSGPWFLRSAPQAGLQWLHAARAAVPFVALLAVLPLLATRGRSVRGWTPAALWGVYAGLVFLGAMLMGHGGFSAVYWMAAYLSALFICLAAVRGPQELIAAESLNRLTWLVVTIVIATLTVVARDVLVEGSGLATSGYGVLGRMPQVGGMAMSRATGMARFAAVPGLVGLGVALLGKGVWRLAGLGMYLAAVVFIYVMQSRGATAGYVGATFFILLCAGKGGRAVMVLLVVALAGALVCNAIPEEVVQHLTRGQSAEEMKYFTGRTRAWEHAWEPILANPLMGHGFEADRWLIGEHVHNTYMYALVAGGLPGLGLFVAGLVWAWALFLKSLGHPALAASGQKMTLVQVGGVLAFFTLRSIPEVCGSNYAVDYLVMLPAILYVHVLWRHLRTAQAGMLRPL